VPHAGERRGKAAIGDFFSKVAAHVNFTKFEPREFIAQGDQVAVVGYYEGTTSAKKGFKSDWVMVFTLKNGKVAAFREFTDSAALNASF
jgi:ketosteroid isomerase-like protein